MSLKNNYNKLKKKYSLPNFAELNKEFNLEEIDADSKIILVKVRGKITEKIESYAKTIESILQPDSNLSSLYETHHVNEKDRKNAYNLFKKLMRLLRKSKLIGINNQEKATADFIKESYKEWQELKSELEEHIARLEKIWKKETDMDSDLSYFG